jgi:hypothetical protein
MLERATTRAQAIMERQETLARDFAFLVDDSPQGYREHAAALRSVSFS